MRHFIICLEKGVILTMRIDLDNIRVDPLANQHIPDLVRTLHAQTKIPFSGPHSISMAYDGNLYWFSTLEHRIHDFKIHQGYVRQLNRIAFKIEEKVRRRGGLGAERGTEY